MSLETSALAALAAYIAPGAEVEFFATTGGPADHIAALEELPALPAAYVVLGDIDNGEQRLSTARQQAQTEWLEVWIATGQTLDALGATAATEARTALDAADDALLALRVDGYHPLEKRGGRLIGYDHGVLWRVAYYSALTYTPFRT